MSFLLLRDIDIAFHLRHYLFYQNSIRTTEIFPLFFLTQCGPQFVPEQGIVRPDLEGGPEAVHGLVVVLAQVEQDAEAALDVGVDLGRRIQSGIDNSVSVWA